MAAEKHSITQSAVSQRIAALEKELGAKLLIRGRSTEVTPEGKLFLKTAHQILETYDDFRFHLRNFHETISGSLRIATVHSIGLHELPPYSRWFCDNFPEVEVKVEYRRATEIYEDIREGRADLGLVAYPEDKSGIVAETFWQDEMVVIFNPNHPFMGRKSLTPKELNGQRFVSFTLDLPTRKAIDTIFEQSGTAVERIMELDNVEFLKKAVQIEDAVSIVPQSAVFAEVEGGLLSAAKLEAKDLNPNRPLGVLWKDGQEMTAPMREFVELLRTKRLF